MSELIERLRGILGDEGLVTSAYGRAMYRSDAGFLNAEPLAVCLPADTDQVREVVRACSDHGVGFTPRGAGTGLAGGAVPLYETVVIGLGRMNRIRRIEVESRRAWVEPGVENLSLDRAARKHGLRYAPDPSSQVACTIGGNVGTNAGGAHCLAHGVTSWHVLALDLVDAEGEIHRLGSPAPEGNGYDLRGFVIGAEGTFGVVTQVCVRLIPEPPHLTTLLLSFDSLHDAAEATSGIIAGGCVPVALEMMDRAAVRLVEDFADAGYPTEAAAILLVEFEGLRHEVEEGASVAVEEARRFGAGVRTAESGAEREKLWKGRKAIAGAIAKRAPDYYLHDVVVPRTRLADVLDRVMEIAAEENLDVVNVLHAGDGNLHPLILFDRDLPGVLERVFACGERIVQAALEAGGVLTGEHGVGLEKRDFLYSDRDVMTPEELDVHARLREALEPSGLANPGKKILHRGSGVEAGRPSLVPEGTWL